MKKQRNVTRSFYKEIRATPLRENLFGNIRRNSKLFLIFLKHFFLIVIFWKEFLKKVDVIEDRVEREGYAIRIRLTDWVYKHVASISKSTREVYSDSFGHVTWRLGTVVGPITCHEMARV